MKIWTDKEGKQLETKEFFSRWKDGINKVTPLQQKKSNLLGLMIVFAGIIWGIVVSILIGQYWLTTVLTGSFIITGVQFIGIYQGYSRLKEIEKEVSFDVE